jgi:hypothetical protein
VFLFLKSTLSGETINRNITLSEQNLTKRSPFITHLIPAQSAKEAKHQADSDTHFQNTNTPAQKHQIETIAKSTTISSRLPKWPAKTNPNHVAVAKVSRTLLVLGLRYILHVLLTRGISLTD